jgi:hypothetical protein
MCGIWAIKSWTPQFWGLQWDSENSVNSGSGVSFSHSFNYWIFGHLEVRVSKSGNVGISISSLFNLYILYDVPYLGILEFVLALRIYVTSYLEWNILETGVGTYKILNFYNLKVDSVYPFSFQKNYYKAIRIEKWSMGFNLWAINMLAISPPEEIK